MVAVRAIESYAFDGQFQTYVNIPSEVQAGDTVIVMVFGGNRVTSYSNTWNFDSYLTGQEAQGAVLSRRVTAANEQLYLAFDGYDPQRIGLIATVGPAGFQIVRSERDGVAGQTMEASLTTEAPNNKINNAMVYFVGCRNATDVPSSTLGEPIESFSSRHTMGMWVTERTIAETPSFVTPVRSGAVRISIRIYDPVIGDWMSDADPQDRVLTSSFASHRADENYLGDRAARMVMGSFGSATTTPEYQQIVSDGWSGPWDESSADPSYAENNPAGWETSWSSSGNVAHSWDQVWVTSRPDPTEAIEEVTESTLPTTVYNNGWVDPSVVGVEWEPTSTADHYVVHVEWGQLADTLPGVEWTLRQVLPSAAPYTPGPLSVSATLNLPAVSLPSPTATTVEFEVSDLSTRAFTVMDQMAATSGFPQLSRGGTTVRNLWAIRAYQLAVLIPRYRLIYADEYIPPDEVESSITGAFTGSSNRFTDPH